MAANKPATATKGKGSEAANTGSQKGAAEKASPESEAEAKAEAEATNKPEQDAPEEVEADRRAAAEQAAADSGMVTIRNVTRKNIFTSAGRCMAGEVASVPKQEAIDLGGKVECLS